MENYPSSRGIRHEEGEKKKAHPSFICFPGASPGLLPAGAACGTDPSSSDRRAALVLLES